MTKFITAKFQAASIVMLMAIWLIPPALAAGDLTKQKPIVVKVSLGDKDDNRVFVPNKLTFETGKLYKLVLTNPSKINHYFSSPGFAAKVYTRKVQVVNANGTVTEIKGTVREIEVYPGSTVEWWLVPVAAGKITDLHCHVKDKDGLTHEAKGMVGIITIR